VRVEGGWVLSADLYTSAASIGQAKNPVATERLMRYWAEGEGAAKIRWGEPGDFNRCRRELASEGVPAHMISGECANLHHRALGVWPGREGGGKGHDRHHG
jgi:hypothetical protein